MVQPPSPRPSLIQHRCTGAHPCRLLPQLLECSCFTRCGTKLLPPHPLLTGVLLQSHGCPPPHPILILGLSILTSSHQSFKGPPQLPPPHFPVFTIFVALFMCDKSWNLKGHIRLSDHCLGPSLKLEALYCLHSACLPVSQHPGIQQLPGRQAARPGPQGT